MTGATVPFTVGAAQRLTNNGSVLGAVDVLGTIGGGGVFENGVTLESGAHLAPGNSPGTLGFASRLTLANGSVLDFDLGATSDLVRILAGVFDGSDLGGTTVNFTYGTGFVPGSTFTFFEWTGASAHDVDVSDFTFSNATPGVAIVGSTLQVTVVSKLGILGLLGIGLAAACGRRRRA